MAIISSVRTVRNGDTLAAVPTRRDAAVGQLDNVVDMMAAQTWRLGENAFIFIFAYTPLCGFGPSLVDRVATFRCDART